MIERVYSCRNGKVNKIFELGEWKFFPDMISIYHIFL